MSTAGTTPDRSPAAPRANLRPRLAVQALVMAFALTMLFGLAGVLAARIPGRVDVTSTREHRLSARTAAVLARIKRPIDLVLAGDLASMSPADRRRLLDLVATFERASTLLRPVIIDTGATDGLKRFDEFLAKLAQDSAPQVKAQSDAVAETCLRAESAATRLETISSALESLRDAAASEAGAPKSTPESRERYRSFWNTQSAAARTLAADTRSATVKARATLAAVAPPLPVPAVDEAARTLAPALGTVATGFTVLARSLDQFIAEPASEGAARDRARALGAELAEDRDSAARAIGTIDRLPTLPILSIGRAIQRNRAVLLLDRDADAGSISALDADAIMPLAGVTSGGDHRARAEELVATGVAAAIDPARPVLILVHGAPARAGPGFRGVRALVEHLALKGVDVAEWATAVDAEPPPPARTAAGKPRPTVYMNLCMDVRTPDDAQRMGKLAAALTRLVRDGRNVLVSVNTSTLPGAGAPDPMVDFLPALGVTAESGRPLLEESKPRDAPGREVGRDMLITAAGATHALSSAIDGLRTRLPWAVPLRVKATPEGASTTRVEPVICIPASPRLWAEADWNVRQGNPAMDSPRDDAGGPGPWTVAAAIERAAPMGEASQRLLVVGSAAWSVDSTLNQELGVVDGRRVADAPGNFELLSAGVAYLAHRDDAIARSSMARAVPTIPNLSPTQRNTLRAVFVGVVPVGILLLGLVWRAWRG